MTRHKLSSISDIHLLFNRNGSTKIPIWPSEYHERILNITELGTREKLKTLLSFHNHIQYQNGRTNNLPCIWFTTQLAKIKKCTMVKLLHLPLRRFHSWFVIFCYIWFYLYIFRLQASAIIFCMIHLFSAWIQVFNWIEGLFYTLSTVISLRNCLGFREKYN